MAELVAFRTDERGECAICGRFAKHLWKVQGHDGSAMYVGRSCVKRAKEWMHDRHESFIAATAAEREGGVNGRIRKD